MSDNPKAARNRLLRVVGHRWQYFVAIVVLCVGVASSAALCVALRARQREQIFRDFQRCGEDRISILERTLNLDFLEMTALRAFYAGSHKVDRGEFRDFTALLLKNRLRVRVIEWAPQVREAELTAFEDSAARDGYPGFRITEYDPTGRLVPVSRREDYYPIFFVEPADANVAALGFDLAAMPACLEAMRRACDTGRCTMTSKILLPHYPDDQVGVRLFLPVYRKNAVLNTVEDRRRGLEGFVVEVLRLKAIAEESISALTPAGIDVRLIDSSDPSREQLLYYHHSRLRAEDAVAGYEDAVRRPSDLQLAKTLDVAGRCWTVLYTAAPQFVAARTTWYPWSSAAAGLLLTGLLVAYLVGITRRNAKTAQLAAELANTNKLLERDISDRKRMEDELRKAKEAAEAATLAKSTFLANMSHEIRTPMTSILGYADLLTDPVLDPSSRSNYVTVIRRSGEHLLTLINGILDLSKIEAGKLRLDVRRCGVVPLLAEVASVMRPRAEQRGISLSVEYAGAVPETILTDGVRLRQALVNLVGNAVKFTSRGSVRVVVSFLADWRGGRPAIRIEVIDTGIGIRKEILPHLFEPFYQGDESVPQKFGGTGLGLTISHHIAEVLGGELTVASTWGQGSSFTLTVPTGDLQNVRMLQHPAETGQDTAGRDWQSPIADLRGVRILLAEDSYDNRELIRTILHGVGAEVETAENGRLAVAKAEAEPFDVILMDINMPELDGYEATRLLRDRGYARPILALTANAMSGDSEQCRAAGCDEHLAKPIDRVQLVQTIAAHVGKNAPGSETMPAPTQEAPCQQGAIVSQFADDPELAMILGEFVGRLEGQVAAMRQAYTNGRHEELQRCAHRLKGAGGSYGYPSLTDACKVLEDAVKAQDNDAAKTAIDVVAEMTQAIQNGYATVS